MLKSVRQRNVGTSASEVKNELNLHVIDRIMFVYCIQYRAIAW